ncbi:putative PHD Zn-finger protein [Phytophthora cinnamomi]|uniref:putative PHD Zn-finger protein n=1 Tax=Phytophthora cinnamomi TaxID=4785 RepID=UPI00355A9DC4|nr:putative PHD Zn-finger protein [Phytophthora cinnamomi]
MLSVPLMLLCGGDDASFAAETRAGPKPPKLAPGDWLGRLLAGVGAHLAVVGDFQTLQIQDRDSAVAAPARQAAAAERSGARRERPASSPCPSSSSSSNDDSSSSSSASSASSASSDSSDSDSEDEAPPPPANGGNGGRGNGGDDRKEKKEEEEEEKEEEEKDSDSSSSDSSESDDEQEEEDDGVLIDTDDEKDKLHNGVDPTDEDVSGESDGSSDLENSYPRLPAAPVDTLIAFRQQAAQKELQLTEKLKKEVVADARQRQQERRELQRSKKKKKAPQPKRRHSKQSDSLSNGSTHLERNHTNGSTGSADVKMAPQEQEEAEDEWMVDCSCGLKEKNYDDGTSMIQCDSCSHWVHAKCADKQPETVAQEKFLCFRCGWMFDCVCTVRRRPNHDDGQRMVECESCKTWQHTISVFGYIDDPHPCSQK